MFLYGKDRKKEEHAVKILFYDTKSYDKESFEAKAKDYPDIQIELGAIGKGYAIEQAKDVLKRSDASGGMVSDRQFHLCLWNKERWQPVQSSFKRSPW